MALSCAKRKFASAVTMSTDTPRRSPTPMDSAPKRWRIQSPGVTKPAVTATGRRRGTSRWKDTMIDIMKPVAMIQEKPRR